MLNYRKELILASAISILNILFTILVNPSTSPFPSLYVHILNDYAYTFCFILLLFINLSTAVEPSLLAYRFKRLEDYLWFQLKKKAISYAIIFVVFTTVQIGLFLLMDSNFKLMTLLYRNFIFYTLIVITYFVAMIGKKKRTLSRIVLLFIAWISCYFVSIINPEAMLNRLNIFTLLQSIQLEEILRYASFLIAIISILLIYISKKASYINKWLD
ncbi:MAG: hypothetical protein ACRCZJ_09480 [Erysipelotrichaceae bacterium]